MLLVASLCLAVSCGSPEPPSTAPEPSPSASPSATAMTGEDQYLAALARSGRFPANVSGDARDLWISQGREACAALLANGGDTVDARLAMYEALGDSNGFAEPGIAEQAVAIVDAANTYLC